MIRATLAALVQSVPPNEAAYREHARSVGFDGPFYPERGVQPVPSDQPLPDEAEIGRWPGGGGRVSNMGDGHWITDPDGGWVVLYAPRSHYDGLRRVPFHDPVPTDTPEPEAASEPDVYIGPIQHSNAMCQKDGCTCWCQACERHNWRHERASEPEHGSVAWHQAEQAHYLADRLGSAAGQPLNPDQAQPWPDHAGMSCDERR